jgi:hypothetical protein
MFVDKFFFVEIFEGSPEKREKFASEATTKRGVRGASQTSA